MAEGRIAAWRALASIGELRWPSTAEMLQRLQARLHWLRYDPHDSSCTPYDDQLFVAVEDPLRQRAWAVFGWVTD